MLTRRRFLIGGRRGRPPAAPRCGVGLDRARAQPRAAGPGGRAPERSPPGLPARQHAWMATLAATPTATRSRRGSTGCCSSTSPGTPTPQLRAGAGGGAAHARAHATTGARRGCCSPPAGARLLRARRCTIASPIPRAKALSDFELPAIDDYDLCLHLACDDEPRLAAVEAALVHGAALPRAYGRSMSPARLRWRETRTGFVGSRAAGRPPARRRHPAGQPGAPRRAAVHGLQVGPAQATRRPRTT